MVSWKNKIQCSEKFMEKLYERVINYKHIFIYLPITLKNNNAIWGIKTQVFWKNEMPFFFVMFYLCW